MPTAETDHGNFRVRHMSFLSQTLLFQSQIGLIVGSAISGRALARLLVRTSCEQRLEWLVQQHAFDVVIRYVACDVSGRLRDI